MNKHLINTTKSFKSLPFPFLCVSVKSFSSTQELHQPKVRRSCLRMLEDAFRIGGDAYVCDNNWCGIKGANSIMTFQRAAETLSHKVYLPKPSFRMSSIYVTTSVQIPLSEILFSILCVVNSFYQKKTYYFFAASDQIKIWDVSFGIHLHKSVVALTYNY